MNQGGTGELLSKMTIKAKLVWDFEFNQRETTTSRRPDLIQEMKNDRKILICAWLAVPLQQNIDAKRTGKLTKYRQLAFETRERDAMVTILRCNLGRNGKIKN